METKGKAPNSSLPCHWPRRGIPSKARCAFCVEAAQGGEGEFTKLGGF